MIRVKLTAATARVLAAALCFAAAPARAEVTVGVVGGANLARLFQADAHPFAQADYGWVARFAAGGLVEFAGHGRLALRLEPTYVGRGSQFPDPSCPCLRPPGYVPGHNDLRLDYVDLPVLLLTSLGSGPSRPFLVTGLVGSYMAGAAARRNGVDQAADPTLYLRRWDMSVALGAGAPVITRGVLLRLEARVAVGLLPIDESSSRNLGLQLLAVLTRRPAHP
jgi:hypothetical protein